MRAFKYLNTNNSRAQRQHMRIPNRKYKQGYIGDNKRIYSPLHLLSPNFYRHIVFVSSTCTKLSILQSTSMDEWIFVSLSIHAYSHKNNVYLCVCVRKNALLRKRICVLNILFESLLFVASLFCG